MLTWSAPSSTQDTRLICCHILHRLKFKLPSCQFSHNAAGQVYWSQNPLYSIAVNTALFACIGIILLHNKKSLIWNSLVRIALLHCLYGDQQKCITTAKEPEIPLNTASKYCKPMQQVSALMYCQISFTPAQLVVMAKSQTLLVVV